MFNLYDLFRAALFALSLLFLCYSVAAVVTTTEPGIEEGDKIHRALQAIHLGFVAALFASLYLIASP